MIPSRQVTAIVLAAGRSTRTGTENKLLLPFADSTLLGATVERARGLLSDVIVVTGHHSEAIADALCRLDVRAVYNDRHEAGMAGSIAAGVAAAADATCYLIWPGDMPAISAGTVCAVAGASRLGRIIVPAIRGRRGHPVSFSNTFRAELMELRGDAGARSILDRHPEAVDEIPVADPGILLDVDTMEDYREAIRRRLR